MSVYDLRDSLTGENIYKENQYKIYKYTDDFYKLIKFKTLLRSAGYELESDKNKAEKGTVNCEKLDSNLRRTKSKIFELALCNNFTHFCTFTIDGKKYPRDDLKVYYKAFSKFLNNIQRTKGKLKYLLIPELHTDGQNWHIHGLMSITNENVLKPFEYQNKQKYNAKTRKKLKDLYDKGYLNFEEYEKKFGFCSFGKIKDKKAVSKYITKYIVKNIDEGYKNIDLNSKLYYCSKGLKTREEIKNGTISDNIATVYSDFENEYVMITELTKSQIQSLNII